MLGDVKCDACVWTFLDSKETIAILAVNEEFSEGGYSGTVLYVCCGGVVFDKGNFVCFLWVERGTFFVAVGYWWCCGVCYVVGGMSLRQDAGGF